MDVWDNSLDEIVARNINYDKKETVEPMYKYILDFPRGDKVSLLLYEDRVIEHYINPNMTEFNQTNIYKCPALDSRDILIHMIKEWNVQYELIANDILKVKDPKEYTIRNLLHHDNLDNYNLS